MMLLSVFTQRSASQHADTQAREGSEGARSDLPREAVRRTSGFSLEVAMAVTQPP
jgi:hypothetical protein